MRIKRNEAIVIEADSDGLGPIFCEVGSRVSDSESYRTVKISGPETNDVTFFPEHLDALIAVLHEAKKFLDEHDNADE